MTCNEMRAMPSELAKILCGPPFVHEPVVETTTLDNCSCTNITNKEFLWLMLNMEYFITQSEDKQNRPYSLKYIRTVVLSLSVFSLIV